MKLSQMWIFSKTNLFANFHKTLDAEMKDFARIDLELLLNKQSQYLMPKRIAYRHKAS